MTSLEDFLRAGFSEGVVRYHTELHVTPNGVVKLRMISGKHEVDHELEAIVKNNELKPIENVQIKDDAYNL